MKKSAIIGIGNKLLGDEGVGIHAIEYLRKRDGIVDILDGGTDGMALLHILGEYERVVIIDAVDFGSKPGDVRSFGATLVPDSAQISLHGVSLAGLLELAKRLNLPMPQITIIGIQPKEIKPGMKLSTPCQAALRKIPDIIKGLPELF